MPEKNDNWNSWRGQQKLDIKKVLCFWQLFLFCQKGVVSFPNNSHHLISNLLSRWEEWSQKTNRNYEKWTMYWWKKKAVRFAFLQSKIPKEKWRDSITSRFQLILGFKGGGVTFHSLLINLIRDYEWQKNMTRASPQAPRGGPGAEVVLLLVDRSKLPHSLSGKEHLWPKHALSAWPMGAVSPYSGGSTGLGISNSSSPWPLSVDTLWL